jgi:hypothetical protein
MRGLEVHLNRNKLCTAGIGPDGGLHAIADVIGRTNEITNDDYCMGVHIGGLENDEHLTWKWLRDLRIGDEIRIRVVETDTIDAPSVRRPREKIQQDAEEDN